MIAPHVLTTKLFPPLPRAALVARPRLLERLNSGLEAGRQLILISAAAGFGKTTLASGWIAASASDYGVAWLSLDEEDNHPNRFLFYLIAALQQVDPALGAALLPLLQSTQPAPWTDLVEQLLNQIAGLERPLLLLLDDYHLLTSREVHQMTQRLIERQPGSMRTVILTREDPPLPLPRMRARGQVVEVRERDLRFTLPEAQAFLIEGMGLALSADEVGRLNQHAEGWAAGMQLAALALEDNHSTEDRHALIEAFTGSDRLITDYLVSEVLDRQSEPVREFLLHTSVLERFCAALCDEVVYGAGAAGSSQALLERLEQAHMFLVPLDNQRRWYRYHHLFAEMLHHSLRRSAPTLLPVLYRRASSWYAAQEQVSEAVKYALAEAAASGDFLSAAGLVRRSAMRMNLHGQAGRVLDWCQSFPKIFLDCAPDLHIYAAWALVLTFRSDFLEAIDEKLRCAIVALETADLPRHASVAQDGALVVLREWVTGHVCAIRSQILLSALHGAVDPQQLITLSLTALDLLPEVERGIRATCMINLAHAQLMQSNAADAQHALEQAMPAMLQAGNYLGVVTSIFYQARLAYCLGQRERAEGLCQHAQEQFAAMEGVNRAEIPALRGLDIVRAILLIERGQVDEAETLLAHALDLLGWASWMEVIGFLALARLRHLRGDSTGAAETLDRMATMGPQHAQCADVLRHLFAMRATPDDPQARAAAQHWASGYAPNLTGPIALGIGPYHCDVEYFCSIAWAEVQIALGQPAAALRYLQPALHSAQQHNLPMRVVELTVLRALALQAAGDMPAALDDLRSALDAAETYGFTRIFADSPATARLLQRLLERSPRHAFARQLAAPGSPYNSPAAKTSPALAEVISAREAEVLALIAAGLSNAQICARLYISEGTVKRHITNLYGKLGVQSRTQALVKARELGLMD